jgi:hypothetical protein
LNAAAAHAKPQGGFSVETFFARRETRQWLVVAILLLCMIIVAGPTYSVYAVFFTPLLKEFHFTRAQLSSLSGALFLSLGLSEPVIGWLLEINVNLLKLFFLVLFLLSNPLSAVCNLTVNNLDCQC